MFRWDEVNHKNSKKIRGLWRWKQTTVCIHMQSMYTHLILMPYAPWHGQIWQPSLQTKSNLARHTELNLFHLSETTSSIHTERKVYLKIQVPQFKSRKNTVLITVQCRRMPGSFSFLSLVTSPVCFSSSGSHKYEYTHLLLVSKFKFKFICMQEVVRGSCSEVVLFYLCAFLKKT